MPMRTTINGREVEISDEQVAEIAAFHRANTDIATDISERGGVPQREWERVQVERQRGGGWRSVLRWLKGG